MLSSRVTSHSSGAPPSIIQHALRICLFDCIQCVTPQIVVPSRWNEGLITSTVRVMHAKWSQITLFWVGLELFRSFLHRYSMCLTLFPLYVLPPSPCPTSSMSLQSACWCLCVCVCLFPCSSVSGLFSMCLWEMILLNGLTLCHKPHTAWAHCAQIQLICMLRSIIY